MTSFSWKQPKFTENQAQAQRCLFTDAIFLELKILNSISQAIDEGTKWNALVSNYAIPYFFENASLFLQHLGQLAPLFLIVSSMCSIAGLAFMLERRKKGMNYNHLKVP